MEHRADLAELISIVKELEAMNRTDVSAMVIKMDELQQSVQGNISVKHKDVSIQ